MRQPVVITIALLIAVAVAFAFIVTKRSSVDSQSPLFHRYSTTEGKWKYCVGVSDPNGTWVWVDENVELLLVVISGSRSRSRANALFADESRATAKIGDDDSELFVTFHRTVKMRQRMLIVLPDGRTQWVALNPGEARNFYERLQKLERESNLDIPTELKGFFGDRLSAMTVGALK